MEFGLTQQASEGRTSTHAGENCPSLKSGRNALPSSNSLVATLVSDGKILPGYH